MHAWCRTFVSLLMILALSSVALAQQSGAEASVESPADDTPEGRMKKWGLTEDPGLDPDPMKIFIRKGLKYRIDKFDLKWAEFDVREGWVRPRADMGFEKEVYRKDDQFVWVWAVASPPEEVFQVTKKERPGRLSPEAIAELEGLRKEFVEIPVERTGVTLKFRESSEGLPTGGSWRNSLDVGDMNNDGFLDIVAPPQRGSINAVPVVFLGDGNGNWRLWEQAVFDRASNYGSVSVGDLNKDGNLDVVCAVHLFGVIAYLGDGKGKFTDSSTGLSTNFPTRRARLADVDRDGDLDILALTEGPAPLGEETQSLDDSGWLRIFLNEKNGAEWKLMKLSESGRLLGGDWLSVRNLNGDKYPDFVAASIYWGGPDVLWVSAGAKKWKEHARGLVPWHSIYQANTIGHFSAKNREDAVVAFSRAWPGYDPKQIEPPAIGRIVGLERLSWKNGKVTRTPIVQWESNKPVGGMGSGDFDGDGRDDVVYWNSAKRGVEFLLGDGKGGFKKAEVLGMDLPENSAYDITVADVNGDKKPDILMMFETRERGKKDGSIRVWLNRSGT